VTLRRQRLGQGGGLTALGPVQSLGDARGAGREIRAGHQPEDRQGANLKIPPSVLERADEKIQ
jgi:hypothetical protein